jgi:hypothetical protein
MQYEVAWDLEQAVADKKHPCAESECFRAEFQLSIHLQSGESDVNPVEPRRNVQYEEKRN